MGEDPRYFEPTGGSSAFDFEWARVKDDCGEDWTVRLAFPHTDSYELTVGGKELSADDIDTLIQDLRGAKLMFELWDGNGRGN